MILGYPRSFWLLSLSSFLFFSSFNMVIPELPDFLRGLGGEEYIGLIISLFTLTAGLSRPFSGQLTDRWGRIPVMVVGALVSAVASLCYPFVLTVAGFFAIRLIHGFSTGFKPTGTSAYIADIVPPGKRGEALGISSFFGSTGMAAGPAMGSLIYLHYGLNVLFVCSSFLAVASVIILVGMKETLQEPESFHPRLLNVRWSEVIEPGVILPASVMFLTTISFGTLLTLSPDFSKWLGIENKGLFFTFFTGSSLLVRILGGRLSDKFGRVAVLKWSTSILGIGMCVTGLANDVYEYFIGAVLFGLGYGLNTPSLFAWAIDRSPEQNRGRGISTLFISLELGIGLGAFCSGWAYQDDPQRFPVIFSVAGVFSFFAFFVLPRNLK